MEPLTTAAIALATILSTKTLEKIGENIGDTLSKKTQQFLASLKKQAPATSTAIEQAPEQPLDYGQAVLEIQAAATANPALNQAMQELATAAATTPPANLADILTDIKQALAKSPHPPTSTFIQNIEKAINAAQNQTIDQRGSTFNF
jgi:hypothetical protein